MLRTHPTFTASNDLLAADGKQGRENRPRIDSGGEEYSSWTGVMRNTGYAESDGGEDQKKRIGREEKNRRRASPRQARVAYLGRPPSILYL